MAIPSIESYDLNNDVILPKNLAPWVVDPTRAVLLIHDMQCFFAQKLPSTLHHSLVSNIVSLREFSKANNIPVAYTAQNGDMTPTQRGLLKDFWGVGMKASPEERSIVPLLKPEQEDWQFAKWRYSALFNTDLLKRLRDAGRDQLIITGIYAHIEAVASERSRFL